MPPPEPLRADARRNREAILCAAASVFAEEGAHVSLEHVAGVAGVGVGTIYRRFASVDELLAVVLESKMTAYADRSVRAAEDARDQPGQAFEDFVLFMLEQQVVDRAFSEVILEPAAGTDVFRAEIGRALEASTRLIQRARWAGVVRSDLHHSDLYLMLTANAGVVRAAGDEAAEASSRFGRYALDAFRGGDPLPPPPAAWMPERSAQAVEP